MSKDRNWLILVVAETAPECKEVIDWKKLVNKLAATPMHLPKMESGQGWSSCDHRDGSFLFDIYSSSLETALYECSRAVDMAIQDQDIKHSTRARRLYVNRWEYVISRLRIKANDKETGERKDLFIVDTMFHRDGSDIGTIDSNFGVGNWPSKWDPRTIDANKTEGE